MDSLTEFAVLLKERENPGIPSIIVGKVLTPLPDIKIRLNDVVVLKKERLVFSASLLAGFAKEAKLTGDIKFTDTNCGNGVGQTNSVYDGGYQASSHSHLVTVDVTSVNIDTTYTASASVEFTDTIKEGDEVILMPTNDEQIYYVMDKAVRLE